MADSVTIVIPARYASQRYPGKPLATLLGATGQRKSLIQRSWEAAQRVPGVSQVLVATDSDEIAEAAEAFGAQVVHTSSACRNGTERCAEVFASLGNSTDIVVNLQGDAPLTPPHFVEAVIDAMRADPDCAVTTPVLRVGPELYRTLADDERQGIVGGTFAVTSTKGHAHYFSKRMIPHFDLDSADPSALPALLHVGLYAYRPSALRAYAAAQPSALEQLEGLEQLRFLELGMPIRVVEVAAPDWDIWELNNPSDVAHIERALKVMGVE